MQIRVALLVLVEVFEGLGVEFATLAKHFLQVVLLLVAHHGYIRSRPGDALGLPIPDHGSLLAFLACLLGLVLTKNVGSLARESTQVLSDFICTCICFVRLPFSDLLVLLFPLGIHDANFEVLSPLALYNHLLAVGTLLSAFLLRRFLCLVSWPSHIVFHNFHLRIEGSSLWQLICRLDCLALRLCCYADLVRIGHAFQLFVFSHVHLDLLLDKCRLFCLSLSLCVLQLLLHFLVVIKFNLLNDHKVKPVDILSHLAVFWLPVALRVLKSSELLLLVHVHLPVLACIATPQSPLLFVGK